MPKSKQLINKKKNFWHQRWWGIVFLTIGVLAFIYLSVIIYKVVAIIQLQNQARAEASKEFLNSNINIGSSNLLSLLETTDDPYFGYQEAKLVIVVFFDFQCPFCKEVYPTIKKIRQEYQDKVKIIYRDLPDLANHPDALTAAMAAECADEQNQFWPYHDKLFENQNNLSKENLKLIASQLGLNSSQFNQCLDNEKYLTEVQNDLQDALKFGVTGTPTFFISGNKVPGVIPYETFKLIIEKALRLNNKDL